MKRSSPTQWDVSNGWPIRVDGRGSGRPHPPLFPYSLQATYTGSGCGGEAGTFVPVMPAAPTHDNDDWAGKEMFTQSAP